MQPLRSSTARFDIEALRAFAVASVLCFHAGFDFAPAGFIGVDIFFVISGYLIIGQLHREWSNTGGIRLAAFWARRARRLLPASAVVLAVTAFIAWPLAGKLNQGEIRIDLAAAALYLANLRFATAGVDYWAAEYVSPALHFWSLAVEEQFYILTPLAIGAVLLVRRLVPKWLPASLLGIVALVSFIYALVLTPTNPVWGYYSTATRAWQFAVGGLAAILPATSSRADRDGTLNLGGWVILFWAALFLDPALGWPNWQALLLVGATTLLLRRGDGSNTVSQQLQTKWKALALPIAWLGSISYGAYLWHWPLLWAVSTYQRLPSPEALDSKSALPVLLLTLAVAAASKKYIEDPIRFHPELLTSVRNSLTAGWAATGAATAVALASVILPAFTLVPPPGKPVVVEPTATVTPEPTLAPSEAQLWVDELIADLVPATNLQAKLSEVEPAISELREDKPWVGRTHCVTDKSTKAVLNDCDFADTTSARTIVLFGDSHAEQYFSGLAQAAAELKLRLRLIVKPSCPAADVNIWLYHEQRKYPECQNFYADAISTITKLKPELVITSSLVTYSLVDPQTEKLASQTRGRELWRAGVKRTIESLTATGAKVLVVRDLPNWGFDVADCLATYAPGECIGAKELSARADDVQIANRTEGGVGLDLTAAICQSSCFPLRAGAIVVRDDTHLSATYSRELAPLWREILRGLLPN